VERRERKKGREEKEGRKEEGMKARPEQQ